jgi:hypothetical protein
MTVNRVFSIEVRIYVFYISLKDLYFILLTHHPSFLFIFAAPTSFWEHFQCRWNSWIFWFASSRREQCRRAPAWAKTYCCKEEGLLNISPHHFDVSSFSTPRLQSPLIFWRSHTARKVAISASI